MKNKLSLLVIAFSFLLSGCWDSFYEIKDPVYYVINSNPLSPTYDYDSKNTLSDKNIELLSNPIFEQICSQDKCSKFKTEGVNNSDNIKEISIIPIYSSYFSFIGINPTQFKNLSKKEGSLSFIAISKETDDKEFKDLDLEQSLVLVKVIFKDAPEKALFFKMNYQLNNKYGVNLVFDNKKSVIYAKQPEVFQLNYSDFNSFISDVISKSLLIKDKNDKINKEKEENIQNWKQNEIK